MNPVDCKTCDVDETHSIGALTLLGRAAERQGRRPVTGLSPQNPPPPDPFAETRVRADDSLRFDPKPPPSPEPVTKVRNDDVPTTGTGPLPEPPAPPQPRPISEVRADDAAGGSPGTPGPPPVSPRTSVRSDDAPARSTLGRTNPAPPTPSPSPRPQQPAPRPPSPSTFVRDD
jgi:hypothetical protein